MWTYAMGWATLPISSRFVQMRMAPGGCFDDGELRDWE